MEDISSSSDSKTAGHRREQPVVEKQTLLLRKLHQDEMSAAVELTWQLCSDPANRSYPLFGNQDEIRAEYSARLQEQNAALLGCFQGEHLIGLLCYFFHPGEHYLQTTAFVIAEDYDTVASAFVEHLRSSFRGYETYIGITAENTRAASILRSSGYELIEASLDMRLRRGQFIHRDSLNHEIVRIDRTNFDQYAGFHKTHFDDMFWNAERLHNSIDQWAVFALKTEGEINGGLFLSIDADMAEVFGMAFTDSADEHVASALLSRALKTVFDENPGVNRVVFFTDEDENPNHRAALSCGFLCRSRYRCYLKLADRAQPANG